MTGNKTYLHASVNAYRKLDRDQMLVDGVCSSTEGLKGKGPLDSHETCDIADYTWSVGHLLMTTGLADYADKIERACFNAAPGAVTRDFTGIQYFSCPNQVIATTQSNHNLFFRGFDWMSYQPDPAVQCCAGEVNRIMPNFAARLWMRDNKNGLAAILYAPNQVTTRVGAGQQEITICEDTHYPFSEIIAFTINTLKPVNFPLTLRIPGWCSSASLVLNDKQVQADLVPGSFYTFDHEFKDGDRVILTLPMHIKLQQWPRGGISIERGPLVYALKIAEEWEEVKEETYHLPGFPAWNLYPASRWNYALVVNPDTFLDQVQFVNCGYNDDPWSIETAPFELHVPARRVKGWKLIKEKTVHSEYLGPDGFKTYRINGNFTFTPQLPSPRDLSVRLSRDVEIITLVPYGCTRLRISIFPYSGS